MFKPISYFQLYVDNCHLLGVVASFSTRGNQHLATYSIFRFIRWSHLFEITELLVSPETLQVIESIDVVECVSVVSLRERPRLPALLEQPDHHVRDRKLAVGTHVADQLVQELLAKGVRHLWMEERREHLNEYDD